MLKHNYSAALRKTSYPAKRLMQFFSKTNLLHAALTLAPSLATLAFAGATSVCPW